MNCPACGHRNPDRAKFCLECGAAFAMRCARCETELPAKARFCMECGAAISAGELPAPERAPRDYTPKHLAEKILGSKSALEGERKQVTVLFADVKGSLELAEQVDPEEWHRILERFFQILADGVHRFEGTINQYTGDGIMALFGAPIAHEDHAQRACYAALHLGEELRGYARELRRERGLSFSVRMGINSGEVVVAKIGDDLRMDYTAQGHTVGLAARMQELAEPGRVYLTEHSARLVEGFFELEDLGAFSLKGSREPLGVFQLEGLGPLRTRFDASRARGLARFVGRADELASLEAALERAKRGEGPVVGVVSEAGVGKSRLCFEFALRCRAREIPVLEAHAVAHGKQIPLLPMLELFRAFFGIGDSDSDRSAREKIAGRLMLLDEGLREALPLVFDLLGVPDPERPPPEMEAEVRQHRVFAVLKRIVRASGQREAVVTLIEDLHWMDAASDALLEQMVEAMVGTRGLLLVNFRPEYHARWMQKSSYQQIPLVPLGPEAIRELMADLLGEDPSVARLPERIRERTGGNPFFIEEVIRSLVESGHLEGRRGAYRLATPVEEVSVPATVQAVLAARIDRLAEREKQLLQTASVIGKTFSERMLRKVAELSDPDLSAAISSLRDAEFLYEESLYPELVYAFKHALTQEVAYGSQLRGRRALVHAAVARAVAELEPEKLDERAALVAHHWEAAGEDLEAARWNRRAARWARWTDPGESLRHWCKVEALLRDVESTEEGAGLALEACLWILRLTVEQGADPEENAAIFERGSALAKARGDVRSEAILTATYGMFLGTSTGDFASCLEYLREAAALARGYPEPIAVVESDLATALFISGDLRAAREVSRSYFERVQTRQRATRGRGPTTSRHHWLMAQEAMYTAYGGRLMEATERLERVLQEHRLQRPQAPDTRYRLLMVMCQEISGDAEGALAHAREGLASAEATGVPLALFYAHYGLGMAHALSGAMPEAVSAFEQALQLSRESRTAVWDQPRMMARLADAQASVGEGAIARPTVYQALDLSRQRHNRLSEFWGLWALARILLRSEDPSQRGAIEEALAAAAELLEAGGILALRPFVHLERAALARQREDREVRESELRRAKQLFAEMDASIRVAQIARELES